MMGGKKRKGATSRGQTDESMGSRVCWRKLIRLPNTPNCLFECFIKASYKETRRITPVLLFTGFLGVLFAAPVRVHKKRDQTKYHKQHND